MAGYSQLRQSVPYTMFFLDSISVHSCYYLLFFMKEIIEFLQIQLHRHCKIQQFAVSPAMSYHLKTSSYTWEGTGEADRSLRSAQSRNEGLLIEQYSFLEKDPIISTVLLQNGGFCNGCVTKRCLHNSKKVS